jgi:hypothetical protein
MINRITPSAAHTAYKLMLDSQNCEANNDAEAL